jgi:hypothetical protein
MIKLWRIVDVMFLALCFLGMLTAAGMMLTLLWFFPSVMRMRAEGRSVSAFYDKCADNNFTIQQCRFLLDGVAGPESQGEK